MLPASIRRYAGTQHCIGNVLIRRDGDVARVETYVTAHHYLADEASGDSEMTFLGRYLDLMERRGDCWKIKHRRVVMDWNQNAAATALLDGPPFDGLARGARQPEDPSYAHLDEGEQPAA
jgi:hypothetical protein